MRPRSGFVLVLLLGSSAPLSLSPALGAEVDRGGLDLFEKKIRPALVTHCYKCHSAEAKKSRGGLRLDSAAGLLKG
jgi:hypothetical protein